MVYLLLHLVDFVYLMTIIIFSFSLPLGLWITMIEDLLL